MSTGSSRAGKASPLQHILSKMVGLNPAMPDGRSRTVPCHRHSSFCSHPLSAPQAGGSLVPPGGIAEPQQAAGSHSSPEQHRAQLPQLPCAIPTVRDPRQAGAWLPEGSTQQPLPNCQSGGEETAPAGNMRVLLGAASTLMEKGTLLERQGSGGTSHSTASTPLRGNVERVQQCTTALQH